VSIDPTTQTVLFTSIFEKPVVAKFDQAHSSSDGGLVLLQAADQRLGLCDALASCVRDPRDPSRVQHSMQELIRQRVMAIACGYPDANDASGLSGDPVHKLAVGRDPIDGQTLASQSTLSRFENSFSSRDLTRMAYALSDVAIASAKRRTRKVRKIILDFDPTDDATYGQQPFAFYHGHYGSYCYLPLVATMAINDEPDQYLLGAMLRPGNAGAPDGFEAVLQRLLPRLRTAFRKAKIIVRLDGGFAVPTVLDFLEAHDLGYVVGMQATSALASVAAAAMNAARDKAILTEASARSYGETFYQTQSWDDDRRVVYKAEVVCSDGREPRDNLRCVVTNLTSAPARIFDLYRGRGDMGNRIRELKCGLQIDRTSCSSFLANQARVQLTVAAYMLLQTLRHAGSRSSLARAQVWTLREQLLKLSVWVERSVRRIVLHLPAAFPSQEAWCLIARRLGAATP